ncbi:MAG TPA: acetamidase/formamidase family protein [Xanthobacteraceae bacterium]|nr:acetamidase/formamidase family protein [Xanthobacteraceae bacterium]
MLARSVRCIGGALIIGAVASLACAAAAQTAPANPVPDATLRSTPQNVVWGYITADLPPALTIKSGQTVKIDTVSHQGLLTRDDPVTFFGAAGIPPDQVLQDASDIYRMVSRVKGLSAHVLTGPLYIESAAPGDMLEVRIHKFDLRVPYGVNNSGPRAGVLGDLLTAPTPKIINLDPARNVALFSREIEIPLSPFMGIMAVAPPRDLLLVSSRPPSKWGGNMDFNKLAAGATLYVPVFNTGAQFFTGDSHAVQGDGEVNGTAIEASLSATLQFIIHKGLGKAMQWPRAEDAANYYTMGMDLNLDVAMREATRETVEFLQQRFGLTPADAYALASIAVDFRIAEAVDSVQVVYGSIPKKLFKNNAPYWATR